MIYHKYDYHDNFLLHLSWYRIYHFRCFIINTEPRDHRCCTRTLMDTHMTEVLLSTSTTVDNAMMRSDT